MATFALMSTYSKRGPKNQYGGRNTLMASLDESDSIGRVLAEEKKLGNRRIFHPCRPGGEFLVVAVLMLRQAAELEEGTGSGVLHGE